MDKSDFFYRSTRNINKNTTSKTCHCMAPTTQHDKFIYKRRGLRGGAELKVEERGNIYLTTENGLT